MKIFEGLSQADFKRVCNVAREIVFNQGDFICHQGDPTNGYYVIIHGNVIVERTITDENGVEFHERLDELGPGSLVGELG